MSNIVEKISIAVGMDTTELKSGMQDVMNTIQGGMRTAAMGISAAMLVDKIRHNMQQFTAELSELNKTTKNVEMSVESLETWKNAAREFGADAEQFGRVFTGVNDAMFQMITRNRGVLKRLIEQGLLPDIRDAEGNAKKTEQYVLEMSDALAGMDRRTAANTLKQVAGVTDIDSVEFLMQGTKAMKEQIEQAKNLEHFTTKDVAAAKELEKAQSKMANAVKMTFLPVFRALVGPMTKFADLCTMIARHAEALYPALAVLVYILGKQMYPAIQRVILLLRSMFLTPAGALLAALIVIGLLLEDIYVWATGGKSAFGKYYQAIADFCKGAWQKFVSFVEYIGGIGPRLQKTWQEIKQGIRDAIEGAYEKVREMTDAIADFIAAIWDAIVGFVKARISNVVSVIGAYCTVIQELWEAMADLLQGNFDGAMEHIKNAFNTFYQPFKEAINWIFEKLRSLANTIPGLSGLLGKIGIDISGPGETNAAGEAVPAAAVAGDTTNNTTNTTNNKYDTTITIQGNATPDTADRLANVVNNMGMNADTSYNPVGG